MREADRDRLRTFADFRGRRIGTLGGTIAYDLLLANAAASPVTEQRLQPAVGGFMSYKI